MRRKQKHTEEEADINMTPMLDIVFIMLIFFIVTTSFVKEIGIDVNRPTNAPPETKEESEVVLIEITDTGQIKILAQCRPTSKGHGPRSRMQLLWFPQQRHRMPASWFV